MSAAQNLRMCEGLGMHACYTCARNVDNNPDVIADRLIQPAADPPRCMDWQAMPVVPRDAIEIQRVTESHFFRR